MTTFTLHAQPATARALACPTCRDPRAAVQRIGPSVFSALDESRRSAELRAVCGDLYRCPECRLIFRWPIPSPELLRAAYDDTPVSNWQYTPPDFWKWTADAALHLAPNRRILDVGCFRGDFLASLPSDFQRFGIEPNRDAAHIAASRGVTILGDEVMRDYSEHRGSFGAITLMDVIEHVPDPAETLAHLRPLLAPRGIFIIITGDAAYWLARLSLPFYYYTAYPTHLVFLSRHYLRAIAGKLDLQTHTIRSMTHERLPFSRRCADVGKIAAIMAWQRWLRPSPFASLAKRVWPFSKAASVATPPHLPGLRDHQWAVLQASSLSLHQSFKG